ncbi:ATP-binding cassette domain-containing protein [Mesorhizobium sp. M1233]|uniref:ATP-binding cassette domain-containing protein n=1 Tax=Mesorhizobium sp. M1233 TaxID=2957072 RepID=UPI003339F3A1
MTALASIRNLTVTYRRDGAEVAALKNVGFDITAGERFAIIGESGSGKSTLALAIAGLLPATARIEGRIDWLLRPPPMFGAKAPPSVLPDISPSKGEIGSSAAGSFPPASVIGEGRDESAISPLEGRCPAGQKGARQSADHSSLRQATPPSAAAISASFSRTHPPVSTR